jgi:hypothetical protein
MTHVTRWAALLVLAALAHSGPARADVVEEEAEPAAPPVRQEATAPSAPAAAECGGWFPDIKCGRHGRFDGFEMPIVQPYLLEDPFITTGVYPYYVYHSFPSGSILGGGYRHLAAVQIRVALTDRLAFIATKDGYAWDRPGLPLLPDQDGWMNLAGGLKYAFIQDRERNFIVSGALKVEYGFGDEQVFEGASGAVLFTPQISAAYGIERLHLIADLGGAISTDGDVYSDQIFWHLYADYGVHEHFQPFVQFSFQEWIDGGDGSRPVELVNGAQIPMSVAEAAVGVDRFEAVDVGNLGNIDPDGLYATWALGVHFPINEHVTLSAAFEQPITSREDITDYRITSMLRLEF